MLVVTGSLLASEASLVWGARHEQGCYRRPTSVAHCFLHHLRSVRTLLKTGWLVSERGVRLGRGSG
jgi:hypothetical protein